MRPLRVLLVAILAAGCTALPAAQERALEAASIEHGALAGRVELGGAFVVEHVRLGVAHEDAPARGAREPVALAGEARVQTALAQDHFVLEIGLRERVAGSATAAYEVSLDWNGRGLTPLFVHAGPSAEGPRGLLIRYDVGAALPVSNLYVLRTVPTPLP